MKKLVLFFMIAGIALGLFLGVRSAMIKEQEEDIQTEIPETTYQNYLNLPLIEVDTLNPILTQNKQVSDILKLVYEPLVNLNYANELQGALATEWMEKDDLNWIISLRKNVYWHSQKTFSAEDVVFTVNSIKENTKSPYYENVQNIASIASLDGYTISITLAEKDSLLPYKLTFPILPSYYFKDSMQDEEKAKRMIGTGPYKYVNSSDDGIRITLEENNSWWNEKDKKLKTIYLYQYRTYGEAVKAFKSSEIDVITTSMSSWEKKFGIIGLNSYRYENEEFETLIPNCQNNILQESSVRRAILYAINRDHIIEEVYHNNATKHDIMIHDYSWVYDKEEIVPYSTETAKQLLSNASWKQESNGWSKNIDGKKVSLKLNLMVNKDNDEKCNVAERIKQDLSEIGIAVTIQKVDENTYYKNIENGNFELALGTIICTNEFDLIDVLEKNYANYDYSPMQEQLNKLYLSNISLEDAFHEVQKVYKAEVPYIGLYYKTNVLLTNKAVKGNITPTWFNVYQNIETWFK